MIKQLKRLTVNVVAGANVVTILLMLLTGFSDRFNPASHPMMSWLGMVFPFFLVVNMAFLFFWVIFKWRRLWIPIAGYLLAYVPINTYMPLNMRHDVPEGAIKVLTYNVASYGGGKKTDDAFDPIFDYLCAQKADIVCLQEDVDTWRKYVFDRYKALYPYNDTTILTDNPKSKNGVGIHTRFPIIRKERIPFSSKANGSVAYYLQVGSDTLLVINNHLESIHLSKEDRSRYEDMLRVDVERDTVKAESKYIIGKLSESSAKRAPQADKVHQYISEHRQYPILVCGDFNDTPISYTRHTIADGLTDCYAKSGRGVGLSYNRKGFWVRIDYILCSSNFTPYNCQVDSKIGFSDHYPVFCWLKMGDKP